MLEPPDEYLLTEASCTEDIYRLAYCLAGWALRNGMPEWEVLDWVLDQPRELTLPRGSSGKPNRTEHHVKSGAKNAIEKFDPGLLGGSWDPEPLQELAARVEGSGAKHERYLLAAIALGLRYRTNTPVITGPLLAELAGVTKAAASRVIGLWADDLAGGLFTQVTFDGITGHGRVWTLDTSWKPLPKLIHAPGCNRARARCSCRTSVDLSFTAAKDRYTNQRQWLDGLQWKSLVTARDAAKELGLTLAAAEKLLRSEEGKTFDVGHVKAARRTARNGVVRTPRKWVVADRWQRWEDGNRPTSWDTGTSS